MFKNVLMLLCLTVSCAAQAQLFKSEDPLNGTYDMKLDIGGTVFNDVMVLEGLDSMKIKMSPFQGSITVPGAFTAPIENGLVQCFPWSGECTMNFEILANENGKEFRVYYHMSYNLYDESLDEISGSARLDNDVFLGYFTATKRIQTP